MIQQCANVNDSLTEQLTINSTATPLKRTSEDPEDPLISKRAKKEYDKKHPQDTIPTALPTTNGTYVPPVEDASGLFTIDTNPTPVEQLLNSSDTKVDQVSKKGSSGKKRRRSGSGQQVAQPNPSLPKETSPAQLPKAKRKKIKHDQEKQPQQPQLQASTVDENTEHVAALERKVALRLKEKEDRRQKKEEKKRKRESSHSTPDAREEVLAGTENNDLAKHLKPAAKPSKRRKQELKQQQAAAKQETPNTTTEDNKQANTKQSKQASKVAT